MCRIIGDSCLDVVAACPLVCHNMLRTGDRKNLSSIDSSMTLSYKNATTTSVRLNKSIKLRVATRHSLLYFGDVTQGEL